MRLDLTRKGTYRKRPTKKSDRRKLSGSTLGMMGMSVNGRQLEEPSTATTTKALM